LSFKNNTPQRGKEEIHFIDVNADDFISTADYQKALSEETEYRSSHKKKDGPTSQQKRKHHITYLAHQVLFTVNRSNVLSVV
jgi:proline-rich protein PRCC